MIMLSREQVVYWVPRTIFGYFLERKKKEEEEEEK